MNEYNIKTYLLPNKNRYQDERNLYRKSSYKT